MASLQLAHSKARCRWLGCALLVIFGVYAVVRTLRSVTLLFPKAGWDGHDLKLIYETWRQFVSPQHASAAFDLVTYLPYVWWLLTPVFLLGWPGAKIIWLVANFGFAVFCCYRLSKLLEFGRMQFWLCLVYFFSWVSTGLVIGLGNVALATLTAAVAWYPATDAVSRGGRMLLLLPAAMKHSLTFPLFAYELVRRPKRTLVPCIILGLAIVASMAWAGVGIPQLVKGMKAGEQISSAVWMKENPTVSLLPWFQAFFGETKVAQAVTWMVWFGLAMGFVLLVKDQLSLFAGLLLLALLPIHHRPYDMLVALPALAVFMKRAHWVWAAGVSAALSGVFDTVQHAFGGKWPLLNVVGGFYYQVVILGMLGGLLKFQELEPQTHEATEEKEL